MKDYDIFALIVFIIVISIGFAIVFYGVVFSSPYNNSNVYTIREVESGKVYEDVKPVYLDRTECKFHDKGKIVYIRGEYTVEVIPKLEQQRNPQ